MHRWYHSIIKRVGIKHCDECQETYRFINHEVKTYQTIMVGFDHRHFETDQHGNQVERARIFPDGIFIVYPGAGSDGCTPVALMFGRWYWGVPNGRKIQTKSGLLEPITARAFYGHDWLLKMRKAAGIPVEQIHQFFCNELEIAQFWARNEYCAIVKRHGPKD